MLKATKAQKAAVMGRTCKKHGKRWTKSRLVSRYQHAQYLDWHGNKVGHGYISAKFDGFIAVREAICPFEKKGPFEKKEALSWVCVRGLAS